MTLPPIVEKLDRHGRALVKVALGVSFVGCFTEPGSPLDQALWAGWIVAYCGGVALLFVRELKRRR